MTKFKHIAFHWPYLGLGGVERVEVLLAKMFHDEFNMDVSFFCESEIHGSAKAWVPDFVDIVHFESTEQLIELLRLRRIDIYYEHFAHGLWYKDYNNVFEQIVTIKSELNLPCLFHMHSFVGEMANWGKFSEAATFLRNSQDYVVTLTTVDETLLQCLGIKAKYIPNPVDDSINLCKASTRDSKGIVWVGRADVKKNPIDAIKIFKEVLRQEPTARLTMALAGADDAAFRMRKHLKIIAKECGVLDAVDFIYDSFDVGKLYGRSSVFLCTSDFEGFPMTFIEAAANALPVIMYRLDNVEMARNNKGVFSVQKGDVEGAANAIVHLFRDDNSYRIASAANACKFAEICSYDRSAAYRSILSHIAVQKCTQQDLGKSCISEAILLYLKQSENWAEAEKEKYRDTFTPFIGIFRTLRHLFQLVRCRVWSIRCESILNWLRKGGSLLSKQEINIKATVI